jgi:hypothetical protein
MEYPEYHRRIVEDLMDGKFILSREKHFEQLRKQDEFYSEFFSISFGHRLNIASEFAYLVSDETDENLSRDISIFFAILCYELDRQGKNFLDNLQYSEFSIEEINTWFDNSSYIDLLQSNKQLRDPETRRKLVFSSMAKRNIITKVNDDRFYFTAAFKVFIDYAKELGQNSNEEQQAAT